MTLMTNPPGETEATPPDDRSSDPPVEPRAAGAPQRPEPQAAVASHRPEPQAAVASQQPEPQAAAAPPPVRKSNGLSARGFYTMAAASLLLGLGGFTYLAEQLQQVTGRVDAVVVQVQESEARQNARVDALAAELREELRVSEARQSARVDALAAELRRELRESEARQSARVDELAAQLSEAVALLVEIRTRLELLEDTYVHVDFRLARLETTAGLPPLPLVQSGSTSAADG